MCQKYEEIVDNVLRLSNERQKNETEDARRVRVAPPRPRDYFYHHHVLNDCDGRNLDQIRGAALM